MQELIVDPDHLAMPQVDLRYQVSGPMYTPANMRQGACRRFNGGVYYPPCAPHSLQVLGVHTRQWGHKVMLVVNLMVGLAGIQQFERQASPLAVAVQHSTRGYVVPCVLPQCIGIHIFRLR